jgi:hypothetical protein
MEAQARIVHLAMEPTCYLDQNAIRQGVLDFCSRHSLEQTLEYVMSAARVAMEDPVIIVSHVKHQIIEF